MSIAKRVKTAVLHFKDEDYENALIQAVIAMDATAKRENIKGNNSERCKTFFLNNRDIISCVAMWGALTMLGEMVIHYRNDKGEKEEKNLEEIIYKLIRCNLIHEGEIPKEIRFEHSRLGSGKDGKVVLPYQMIFGFIMAVVGSPANKSERVESFLPFEINGKFYLIDNYWGKKEEIIQIYKDTFNR